MAVCAKSDDRQPHQPHDPTCIVQGQGARIQQLEQALVAQKVQNQQQAQQNEDTQFAIAREKEVVERELQVKSREVEQYRQQVRQHQQRIDELQRQQGQNALQIQAGRAEVRALTAQLEQERAQLQLLNEQLQMSVARANALEAQVKEMGLRIEAQQKEILAAIRQPKESAVDQIVKGVWGLFESAAALWDPSLHSTSRDFKFYKP